MPDHGTLSGTRSCETQQIGLEVPPLAGEEMWHVLLEFVQWMALKKTITSLHDMILT